MKAIEIETMLKEKFVGKNYDSYHYNVARAVIDYLGENGFNKDKLTYSQPSGSRNTVQICVVSPTRAGSPVNFLTIEIKKAKVATHHSWYGGNYCDWAYKDFLVTNYEKTIEESCKKAVATVQARLDANDLRRAKAMEIFEVLKAKGYSKYDAQSLVAFANSNSWFLIDAVWSETK